MAEYGASNIKVLKGLEAVRKRPGMYIGDTSIKGLHHLIYEVVDNSIDEAMAGFCDTIKVTLTKNGSAIIEDNGRGIPVAIHPTEKISAATVVMTVLHAGGKFDKDTYKVSGGLHGVGVSVVNALSKELHLTIFKDGKIYEQFFKRGIPQGELKITGETRKRGTKIEFLPDDTIFTETTEFKKEILMRRFKELAYLNPNIKIVFKDERDNTKEIYHFEGGLKQFVEDLNPKEPLTKPQFFQGKSDDIEIDIAILYSKWDKERTLSFVNNIKTIDGGTHEAGFRAGLTRSIANYISKNASAKERGVKITGEDCKEGLIAVISVRVPEPQFEGQTKGKLGSSYVRPLVQKFFFEKFNKYLEENPIEAKAIMAQVLLAARGREAAKRAKDLIKRKESIGVGTLPGKLADCQTKDASLAEIYLVEGDSAGGCHSGDTKVKCANGKDIPIEIIAQEFQKGKDFFVYTYNHSTNKIELEKITNAWQTKITDDLIYITLDNGKRVLCTSDHPYMLRNGKYKMAKDLKIGDSLMPLYLEERKKTVQRKSTKTPKIRIDDIVIQPDGNRDLVYYLADEWNIKNNIYSKKINGKFHRHHINKNTRDNNPSNIIRLSENEHLNIHKEDFEYRKSPEYRAYMSDKMKEQSKEISQRVIKDWQNPEYREKFKGHHKRMREIQIANGQMNIEHLAEYWADESHRKEQSRRVKEYFKNNPEAKEYNRKKAKEQWSNKELRRWRSEETKKQMSNPENLKRKLISERETRIKNSLELLNKVGLDRYEEYRKGNRRVFKLETLLKKINESENYPNYSNIEKLVEGELYVYNHKVVKIEKYRGKPIPVYDIEVPNTHNFALSSGVFVHNSAKQGRDRVFQAILPLKGKILNVEKSRLDKILKSDEIKNIITALGCGIGEDFNEDKLRYKKIIIMTDADVDGSHIQTLLMTFFFRFFKPLIKKGYLYIAQPPLYRYKKGKNEIYLKDDRALSEFLIENGINSLESSTMGKRDLIELFKSVSQYKLILKELDKRFGLVEIIRYLIENQYIIGFNTERLSKILDEYIESLGFNILNRDIEEKKIHYFIQTDRGLEEIVIDDTIWKNPYFQSGVNLYNKIQMHITDEFENKDLLKLLETIESSAKRGAYIQRYKGLGEMNPDQLWETTMNPENRRLLKVKVEDDESADEAFILFMGDEVEPRRRYIEEHAKDVRYLDV